LLLIAVALTCIHADATQAKKLEKEYIGVWLIEAYTDRDGATFDHCTMSATYDDGVSLIFFLDQSFYWAIGIIGENWQLTPDAKYDVKISVDKGKVLRHVAQVIDAKWVNIAIEGREELFGELRSGQTLYIDTPGRSFSFGLNGTSQGLSALFDCVDRRARTASPTNPFESSSKAADSRNPFAPSDGQDVSEQNPVDQGNYQAEANDTTNKLLQRAGITSYQIKDGEPDPVGFSTIWRNGKGVIGALLVVTEGGREDAEESLAAMMNGTREDCGGKFVSNLDVSVRMHGTYMPRAYAGCSDGGKSVMTYLSAFQRRQGGYYVFFTATVPGGPASMAAELDERIREAAYQLQ